MSTTEKWEMVGIWGGVPAPESESVTVKNLLFFMATPTAYGAPGPGTAGPSCNFDLCHRCGNVQIL